jgi:hypothetical protein
MVGPDSAAGVGYREFEDVLCQIHSDGRSIHDGLLLLRAS